MRGACTFNRNGEVNSTLNREEREEREARERNRREIKIDVVIWKKGKQRSKAEKVKIIKKEKKNTKKVRGRWAIKEEGWGII